MTVRFVADENLNRRIVTGLRRRVEDLDLVRVQDVGLLSADDPTVLEWAAEDGRALLTGLSTPSASTGSHRGDR